MKKAVAVENPASSRQCIYVPPGFYEKWGKRAFDLAIATTALIAMTPVILLSGVLVKVETRGPAFFVQERLGQGGQRFRIHKLRTMTDRPRTADQEILEGHPEVTRVGHLLRRMKIDELPQLLNVISGDMSIVGPRPVLPEQLQECSSIALLRLRVRPGMTGLAQVNGNIHLSRPERWALDAVYVNRQSFSLDLQIIIKTFAVIAFREERFLKSARADSAEGKIGCR